MKKAIKIISLCLSILIIFSSCSLNSSQKQMKQINTLISEGKYSEARQIIDVMDDKDKSKINDDVLECVVKKYNKLSEAEKIDFSKIFDLTSYSKDFTENCRALWNIASLFTINKGGDTFNDIVFLRYFAVMNDLVRYQELYSLFKAVEKSGYLELISNALYKYDESGDNSDFQTCYQKASAFDYSQFNPQQYLIADFRAEHDNIVKYLSSLCNAFVTNDSTLVANSINGIYNSMTVMLKSVDTINAVHSKQMSVFSTLSGGDIYSNFDTEIKIYDREYSLGITMSLNTVFGNSADLIDKEDIPESTVSNSDKISKEAAIKKVLNAINKSKAFNEDVNITLTEKKNIQLTDFTSESGIDVANNITKSQINDILYKTNQPKENTYKFSNGLNGAETLQNFIPPSNKEAVLSPSSVTEYTAVQGSGGYVITLTLAPETEKSDSPSIALTSIIDGFKIGEEQSVTNYNTYYAPSLIMVMINNDGTLSKLQYSINGVSKCEIIEESGKTEKAEFSFDCKYSYVFSY